MDWIFLINGHVRLLIRIRGSRSTLRARDDEEGGPSFDLDPSTNRYRTKYKILRTFSLEFHLEFISSLATRFHASSHPAVHPFQLICSERYSVFLLPSPLSVSPGNPSFNRILSLFRRFLSRSRRVSAVQTHSRERNEPSSRRATRQKARSG